MLLETLAIMFYGIGDLWSTKIGMNMKLKEHNPLVRTIYRKTGFTGLIIFKSSIIAVGIIYLPELVWFMAWFGILLTVWNIRQIVNYKKIIKD
jgi:hypothetical protein